MLNVMVEVGAFVTYLLESLLCSVFEALVNILLDDRFMLTLTYSSLHLPSVYGISFCAVIIRVNGQVNRTSPSHWNPQPHSSPKDYNIRTQTQISTSVADSDDVRESAKEKDVNAAKHAKDKSHSIHLSELLPRSP